jgi:diguanylate cyclase (GGDEF)-like protein
MTETVLLDLIEAWLHGTIRRASLHFPAALEERFEAETRHQRNRMLMTAGGAGLVIALAFYFALVAVLPDVADRTRALYFSAVAVGVAAIALMRFNPPPMVRELAFLLANGATAGACLYLFSVSRAPETSVFVAAFVVLIVCSAIGAQLRFGYAVVSTFLLVGAFAAAVDLRPNLAEPVRDTLKFSAFCIAAYGLLANWRLELAERRLYLTGLRERLQRHDALRRTVEMDELTRRDPLTGLANRRAYDTWLASVWSREIARQGRIGLIVVDIDRFKEYNEFCGHEAGDNCLKKVAVCLRDQLRGTSDQIARLGGEAFVILLPGLTEEICADVAERLRLAVQRMELPNLGLGAQGIVTVSAGVASHAITPGSTPSSLFQAADTALHQAKIFGRNRVCIATLANPAVLGAPALS